MTEADAFGQGFPKKRRLLKTQDFKFRPYKRFQGQLFTFIYGETGSGRLGVSLSKKVLRRAVARNRVRRLIREVFRVNFSRIRRIDIHVLGCAVLKDSWKELTKHEVEHEFERFFDNLSTRRGSKSDVH